MKIAQFQTPVSPDVSENLKTVNAYFEQIRDQNVDLVTLGEMFCCPYKTAGFPVYAEPAGGKVWQALSSLAKKYGVYLEAGSVPETADGKIYNTAYVFDREGRQIARHRKIHLYDVDIQGGQHARESDTVSPGEDCTVFDTEFGRIGLCVCFDIRFPDLFLQMVQQGAKAVLIPADFNLTTGPAHWELLCRARAVDNQCYIFGTSTARDESAKYVVYGHSIAVSPWGGILGQLDEKEGILIREIDFREVDRIRQELPVVYQKGTPRG